MLAVDCMTSASTLTPGYVREITAGPGLFVIPMNIHFLKNLEITSYAFFLELSIFKLTGMSLFVSKISA